MKNLSSSVLSIFLILLPSLVDQTAICQRISERPSVSEALMRKAEPGDGFFVFIHDTTQAAETGRARGATRALLVLAKTGLAGGFGVLGAFGCAHLAIAISGAQGWGAIGPAIIGLTTGYVLGSAFGVYVISQGQNPETSYGNTMLYGTLGLVLGIAVADPSGNSGDFRSWMPAVLPIVFEIVYTEVIE